METNGNIVFRCLTCCARPFILLVSNIPLPNLTSCCSGKGPRKDKSRNKSGESSQNLLPEIKTRKTSNRRGKNSEKPPQLPTVPEGSTEELSSSNGQKAPAIDMPSNSNVVVVHIEPEQKQSSESVVIDPLTDDMLGGPKQNQKETSRKTIIKMVETSTQCNLDVNKETSTEEPLIDLTSSNEERFDVSQNETEQESRVITEDFDVHQENSSKETSVEVEASHDVSGVNERETSFEIPVPKVETKTENDHDIDAEHQEIVEGSASVELEMHEEGTNLVPNPHEIWASRRRSALNVPDPTSSTEEEFSSCAGESARFSQDEYHDAV